MYICSVRYEVYRTISLSVYLFSHQLNMEEEDTMQILDPSIPGDTLLKIDETKPITLARLNRLNEESDQFVNMTTEGCDMRRFVILLQALTHIKLMSNEIRRLKVCIFML